MRYSLQRPLVLPIVFVRWGMTVLTVVALFLSVVALYQGRDRDAKLCRYIKTNREAALLDIREQAQTLITQAIQGEVAAGHIAEAAHVRLVTGPAYVKAQVDAAAKRHPVIDCSKI